MWKLYDELYIGIPSGIRIEGCVIGKTWTTVRANGNVGIARTMELPENPAKFAAGFIGKFLRDTAGHLYWDTLSHASVGTAAMNAWYNTKGRADALSAPADFSDIKDAIIIPADTLITRELPKLLDEAGEGANVILEGWSLPCSALFFSFGSPVRELRGFATIHPDTLEACAVSDITDPTPGAEPFTIRPIEVKRVHQSEKAVAAMESPYKAAPFNNYFR